MQRATLALLSLLASACLPDAGVAPNPALFTPVGRYELQVTCGDFALRNEVNIVESGISLQPLRFEGEPCGGRSRRDLPTQVICATDEGAWNFLGECMPVDGPGIAHRCPGTCVRVGLPDPEPGEFTLELIEE